MAFRNKIEIVPDVEEPASGGRPRRSGRTSYVVNGMNAEKRSSLMNHLLREEEENQREMKRMKEREKKEANEALMQELSGWEDEIFTKNVLKELKSIWEIPSIGSFLWLFLPALNLPELNYTEFEHGFILPHKSQQMAWIFTSLLVTPSQRKSIHKKSPMKFKVWEGKLKEHLDIWYLARQDEELQMVARQIGLNPTFFQILGDSNPLQTKSYIDLTLHQRVLILKVLCDECLDYHPQLRDILGNTDTIPYSETYIGCDAQNSTYLYFPIFDATDIRIYKQAELPALNEWYRKWTSNSKAFSSYKTPKRTSQSKSRRSSTSSKKGKGLGTTIEPGFQLVCTDVESLRGLCEKFGEPPPTPSRKKSGGRPTRKRCEEELHTVLSDLVEELGKNDARYLRARVKGMINLMRDWKSDELDSGDEFNVQNDETADTCSESLHTPLENRTTDIPNDTNIEKISGEEGAAPLLSIVTRSRKRKFLDYDDMTSASSSPVSEFSKNFEAFDDNPDLGIEIRAEKRPNLDNDVVQDSVSSSLCDAIVRDVIYDVIRSVVDDVICDVVDDAISKVSVSESADAAINGVDSDELIGTNVSRNGNEGHGDDQMGVNGVEINGQTEDHLGVSMDDKEQQLMEADSKNDNGGIRDAVMDIDGFGKRQNRATFVDKISNDNTLMTNGNVHKEQNADTRNIELQQALHKNTEVGACNSSNVNEQKSSITYSDQNCHRSEEINSSITGIEGTNMYNNGQCSAVTNTVCNGNLSIDSFNSKIPSAKWSTSIVSTGKESAGMVPEPTRIIPTVKEPTRVISTGNESTR